MKIPWYFLSIYLSFQCLGYCLSKDVDADAFAEKFYKHFKISYETNQTDEVLNELKDDMINAEERSIRLIGFPSEAVARVCLKCYVAAHSFIDQVKINFVDDKSLADFMKQLCIFADIEDESACTGDVNINLMYAKFIFGNKPNLTAEYVCASILPEYFCVRQYETYEHALVIEKPTTVSRNVYNFTSTGNLTVLHLSDFHYDPYYQPGSKSICDQWLCCRGDPIPPNSNESRAGYWGDYNSCDSPGRLLESILQKVAALNQHIDFIYFTGDFVDHFGWEMTKDRIKNSISFIIDIIKKYLPKIPIYPILGNHEGYPANFFSPNYIQNEELSSKWLYEYSANLWKDWLTDEAYKDFASKGYYTMLIRPKLRLVALNSNVCNTDNLWNVYDDLSYQEQLLWFVDILKRAVETKERIHIITHIASNFERCSEKWREDFKRIMQRYSDVIAGHFIGHSHLDEFLIYLSEEDPPIPLNVAWNGGSGTHFSGLNSNFKFVYIDDKTYDVIDIDTYTFNLTQANLAPDNSPLWYKEYSFKSFFNVADLSPSSVLSLVHRFRQDRALLTEYWKVTVKQSDVALKKGCDDGCLEKVLSQITRTNMKRSSFYKGNDTFKSVIVF